MYKKALGVLLVFMTAATVFAEALIIDHNCTDISKVPAEYIKKAKTQFKVSYGHTSHGSQIISGMQALKDTELPLFDFGSGAGAANKLSILDATPKGDLGNPDRTSWADRTRELLNGKGKDRNLVMWSWCGQVSKASDSDIDSYLKLMSKLEEEYPSVKFVYMTGHLDGTGKDGNLNLRNEQIRNYCKKNSKILFDFADIESYDPDGKVNYMELFCKDSCEYKKGGLKLNWAQDWVFHHPGHGLRLPQSAAHTEPLNALLKGRAFWWMLAKLAGWNN